MQAIDNKYLSYLYNTANNQRLKSHKPFIESIVEDCAKSFYKVLLNDRSTKRFLTNNLIQDHLHNELKSWLWETLTAKENDDARLDVVARQHDVGSAHARVEVPMTLVNSAMLVIKEVIMEKLAEQTSIDANEKLEFTILINKLLDASLNIVNESYLEDRVSYERRAQEFRSNTSAHEAAIELERVKGSMLAWMGRFMTDMVTGNISKDCDIAHLEFALWIRHKLVYTSNSDKLVEKAQTILVEMEEALGQICKADQEQRQQLAMNLNKLTNECSWVLSQISEMNVESAAREDALTSLIERRFLNPILQSETHLSLKTQQPYTLMMLDIDNFKKINDIHGHQSGDKVLTSVGHLLKRSLRVTDYAFRYGGEEFLIVMPETSLDSAKLAAEKILNRVRELDVVLDNERCLKTTISIGLAEFDKHPDYEYVIKKADEKLYQAKHNGKDRYEF